MSSVPGIMKTKAQAKKQAQDLANTIQEPVCIFPVPEGTMAHQLGYRFGHCRASERADYECDGATILETVEPSK
jgi:hypothetical protein